MLSVIMLNVKNKPFMLSVIMLNVIKLNVVALADSTTLTIPSGIQVLYQLCHRCWSILAFLPIKEKKVVVQETWLLNTLHH